jgi:hypothetical protein
MVVAASAAASALLIIISTKAASAAKRRIQIRRVGRESVDADSQLYDDGGARPAHRAPTDREKD